MSAAAQQTAMSATDEVQDKHLTLSKGTQNYLAGVVSGLGKAFTGHPFDTVKVRVQSGNYTNSIDAFVKTVRNEGPLALYNGITPSLTTVCFVGGILFYANGQIRRFIQPDPNAQLTYTQMFMSGSGAGFVVGACVTPLEVVKLRLQVINRCSEAKPPLPKLIRQIGWRNMYAGSAPTIIREMGTFGLFFPTNELLKRRLAERQGLSGPSDLTIPYRILAAGFGGILCWLPCYPIDQIKSKMQLEGYRGNSMWRVARDIYRTEGLRHGFFKGITPCLTRAFPAYAAQFILFDHMAAFLDKNCS
eukprot:PhM_4_TR16089/c1_g2_i1/m.38548/K15109/SLC25A20_29, CACT, CACL, CRC1; solute carrier family 25 (mitochondrial carnitine/acylcarnitine transporter), member 20/29